MSMPAAVMPDTEPDPVGESGVAAAQLKGGEVIRTAERLVRRISERFGDRGLATVCQSIHQTCLDMQSQIDALRKPIWRLRIVGFALAGFSAALLLYLLLGGIQWSTFALPNTFKDFVGLLEPTLGTLIFLTAYFVFVVSLEKRFKQKRVLEALTNLRALAHVIDMHQLTKDPERFILAGPDTASSPERTLTPFELGRYLDYCSEMLSILGKVSALWAQAFPEPALITAADQIEMLTTGLSRKIWQKLMVLESAAASIEERMSDRDDAVDATPVKGPG